MISDALTYWQLFGIGFSFGFAGPCLFTCAPVLLVYITGKQSKIRQVFSDIFIFLCGRLLAYLLLGYLAGLSGVILRQFTGSKLLPVLKTSAGAVIILLAIQVWAGRGFGTQRFCRAKQALNCGSLALLGFIVGVFPCAPLLALLFEIALISKSGIAGLTHSLFFGLGTFLSGFIVIGVLSGALTLLPRKLFGSGLSNRIFRWLCAALLILLGIRVIF